MTQPLHMRIGHWAASVAGNAKPLSDLQVIIMLHICMLYTGHDHCCAAILVEDSIDACLCVGPRVGLPKGSEVTSAHGCCQT